MREKPLTEYLKGEKMKKRERKEEAHTIKPRGIKGPWGLPEGWRWVKLEDVAVNVMGGTPKTNIKEYWEGGTIPWITAANIDDKAQFVTSSERKITELGLRNSNAKLVPAGTVLLVTTATVGKLAIAGTDLAINQQITALMPKKGIITSKYLYYALKRMREILIPKKSRGATFIHINQKSVRRFIIPLPPLEEQKRIVAKLDEINKRLEEAKRLAKEAREEAEKLMASALHEVFENMSKQYYIARFEEIMRPIPKEKRKIKLENDKEYKLVTVKMHSRGVILREIKKGNEIKSKYMYLIHTGDFIFSRIDARNGAMGFVPLELDGAVVTQDFPVMELDSTKVLQKYVDYYIKQPELEKIIQDYSTGTTNRQRISEDELLKILQIPLPPLEEQKRIVAYLDSISERAQKLLKLYEEREKELEQLFLAVLDRAFRGELI